MLGLYGEADQYVASELRDVLLNAIDESPSKLVLDLSGTTFVDSMVLGVLLGARKRADAKGVELRLVVPETQLRRVFDITLLDRVLALDTTREEALAAARGSGREAL